jgi:catechol 1,2-dioxygenase
MPALKLEQEALASNGRTNDHASTGANGTAKLTYDPHFTNQVIAATGPNAHARLAQIMPSLLRHLHDFAREVGLTVGEWTAAVDFVSSPGRSGHPPLTGNQLNEAGRMSNDRRNETQLVCDILGLESLVDEITSKMLQQASPEVLSATSSAILGPFYRHNAPILPNGSNIASDKTYEVFFDKSTHLSGRILDSSGRPIVGATVDVWHTAPNGMYEQQDPNQPDYNLRGRFQTDERGVYEMYCLRPGPYPIPDDGPSGTLLKMLDRHPWRPAHIHIIVQADGYRTLTTQLFDGEDPYLENDTVFAVKKDLIVEFHASEADPNAKWTLEYDFVLLKA